MACLWNSSFQARGACQMLYTRRRNHVSTGPYIRHLNNDAVQTSNLLLSDVNS